MKFRVTLSLFALLALISFSACSHEPIIPHITFASYADNEQTVLIEEDGTLHLELETPSKAGVAWRVIGELPQPIKQIGAVQFKPYTDAMGSGNMTLIDFKAQEVGTGEIHLALKNTQSGEVLKTFSMTLDIRPKKDLFVK